MHDSESRVPIQASGSTWSLAESTTSHPWCEASRTRLGKSEDVPAATLDVVRELAAGWERDRQALSGDPWLDSSFAERFTTRVRWAVGLIEKAEVDGTLGLSSAEASLLVVFPYLHQAFWARQALATLRGVACADAAYSKESPLPDFRKFVAEHGTLHRRGTHAFESGDSAADDIAWWLFHRWIVRRPACYATHTITDLLPGALTEPLRSVFTPERLTEMMRVVQIDPAFLRRTDRPAGLKPVRHIDGGSETEEELREQLLGYLLVVAHRTAIDPTALSRDVVDHVGIQDGVTPGAVLESIRDVRWSGKRTRQLETTGAHPATVLALRHQASTVDALLKEIDRATEESPVLAPLKKLPRHVTSEGLNQSSVDGHRFRLADDRVQELLMGEQLYGTPDLAIRELYQNALDACRYRDARTEYLTRTGTSLPPWDGRISFHQDVDDEGRPYLECEDNGIGMGERELIDVFSRAGVRFADLPEYIEEQADWAELGIKSYPNSRFGIGVLSYFMLADEITVTTTRLDRNGRPGRRLEVHISGPGALFRVKDLGQGEDAGTTVRLRLRSTSRPAHCTDLLRRILWISDYHVTSDDSSGQQTWKPHELSRMAPIGSENALHSSARRKADQPVPVPGGAVWWCDASGAVLADGIWVANRLYGAIVNLSGPDIPQLTVDRRTILNLDREMIDDMLRNAIPALLEQPAPLSHPWLSALAADNLRLADDICERAIEAKYRPWRIGEWEMPIEVIGCFPQDADVTTSRSEVANWGDRISRWRLAAWLKARTQPTSPWTTESAFTAIPSDEILLSVTTKSTRGEQTWLPDDTPPALGHILSVAIKAHRSPAYVTMRLAALGYPVPRLDTLPAEAGTADPKLLSKTCDGEPPWLTPNDCVPRSHILLAAISAEMTPRAVVERLTNLGCRASFSDRLPAAVHPSDRRLLLHLAGQRLIQAKLRPSTRTKPLLADTTVPIAHLHVAASVTGRTPAEVKHRLDELGYITPARATLRNDHETSVFIGQDGLYMPNPVPLRHIVIAAINSKFSPTEIATRLANAGIQVPAEGDLPELRLPLDDQLTLTYDIDGPRSPWRYVDASVGIAHVLRLAVHTDLTPSDVAARLSELGYEPPRGRLPDRVHEHDITIVSSTIGNGVSYTLRHEWLRVTEPVHPHHIVIAAAKTRQSPVEVARRLNSLGYDTPAEHLFDFAASSDDTTLLSQNLDGFAPWLHTRHAGLGQPGQPLPLGYVLAAAARLGKTPTDVVARLEVLGLQTEKAQLPPEVNWEDSMLVKRPLVFEPGSEEDLERLPWLGATTPANRSHVIIAAGETMQSPAAVARRLVELGIPVEEQRELPSDVAHKDLAVLSKDASGRAPFRTQGNEFPRGQVMAAASESQTAPNEVIDRLNRLGIPLSD